MTTMTLAEMAEAFINGTEQDKAEAKRALRYLREDELAETWAVWGVSHAEVGRAIAEAEAAYEEAFEMGRFTTERDAEVCTRGAVCSTLRRVVRYMPAEMEELEMNVLDGPITPDDCDGDTQWCDLVNAIVEHDDFWEACDRFGAWEYLTDSIGLSDVPDVVRAVRPVLNGYEVGGWFALTSQG